MISNGPSSAKPTLARRRRGIAQLGIAILSLGSATGFALLFRSVGITESSIVLLYLLSVVIASVVAGRMLGIAASLVAVVLFNFLFTEPRFTFVVNDAQYLVTFPVMLIVAAISSELAARLRRQAEEAEHRETLTKRLYESSRSLLGAQGHDEVVIAAVRHLSDLIDRPVLCVIGDRSLPLEHYEVGAALYDERLDEPIRQLLGRPDAASPVSISIEETSYMLAPVGSQGRVLAVIVIDAGRDGLTSVAGESLSAMVVQLALALEREEMSRREQNARIEIERERLRANLLQSISHDLRSPLAAIVGSASTLIQQTSVSDATRDELARSIRDDARWLTGLVENLLSLTRAEESAVRFQGSVEVLDDVLSAALSRVDRIHETHSVSVDLGAEPVLVRMDSGLIEQLIINLLENVIQHTPPGTSVLISIHRDSRDVVMIIEDNGPGLSDAALEHAFERFYTERSIPDARRGMGLGLSICRSIAEAHAGSISVLNRVDGGACFEVRFPSVIATGAGGIAEEEP